MSIVRKTSADIPPMTEKRAAELRALAERPDSEIDLSDAPELDAEGWKHAMQGRFFVRPRHRSPSASTRMYCTG